MAITIRPRPCGSFQVDITYTLPGEETARRYRKIPQGIRSKGAAQQWAAETLAVLMRQETPGRKERRVPTLAEFWPRFIQDYAKANRQKHSSVESKESIFRNHLGPMASKRLDRITDSDVQALKGRMATKAPKTLNNVLSVLGKALRVAVRWRVIVVMPCDVEQVREQRPKMNFYEADEFERLVVAAKKVGALAEVVILLGGDAGLRAGEMIGLEWGDIDFTRASLTVQRSEWRNVVGSPKSGESRRIPMTPRLAAALRGVFVVGATRVLPGVKHRQLRTWSAAAQKLSGVTAFCVTGRPRDRGQLHILRHTFATRLVSAGVHPYTVKELMGHTDITTTERYMHLFKDSTAQGIAALEAYTGKARTA